MTFNPLLHYDCISTFKKEFYKDLITYEHLQGGQQQFTKLTFPDGGVDDEANVWGYVFEKDGTKYILPAHMSDGNEVNLREILPIRAQDCQKVASRGVVYLLIHRPVTARFRSMKTMTFKQLVDKFSSLGHSNPEHQKLLWFMGLTQMMDRANFRISTPPGFGKDSVVDTLGNLIGKSATIENPTLAKLEERSINLKWLAVNEVVGVGQAEWKIMEQFLLAAGAHKPTITKHSRAFGNVGEELDISQFSISLMYNDIDTYPRVDRYFDFTTKDAVKDRFPAFRLHGRFTENFNEIRRVDVSQYVRDHLQEYKDIIYAFTYYKEHATAEQHHWGFPDLNGLPERWKLNVGKLLKTVDLYCDSQEEFDQWCGIVLASIDDYKEMLEYPVLLEAGTRKVGAKQSGEVTQRLLNTPSFKQKNAYLRSLTTEGSYTEPHGFW
jgi:hypothetical protein